MVTKIFVIPRVLIEQARMVFYLTGIGFFVSIVNMWIVGVASGLQKYQYSNILAISNNVLGRVLGLLIVWLGYGIVGFISVKVVTSLFITIAFYFLILKEFPSFKLNLNFDHSVFKRIIGFTSYGILLRVSGLVLNKLDVFFIGIWISASAVGVYSIPLLIYTTIGYFISAMFHFFFPMSSELFSTNQVQKLEEIFIKLSKFLTAMSTMLYIPIFVFSKIILKLWVGEEISNETNTLLSFLMLAGFLGTIFASNLSGLLIGIGHIKEFTIYSIVKGCVNGLLFFLLMKKYGINGAGITFILTTVLDLTLLIFTLNKYLTVNIITYIKKVIFKPITLGIAVGLPLFLSQVIVNNWLTLISSIILFEVVYVILGFLFDIFGETEKKALVVIFKLFNNNLANE